MRTRNDAALRDLLADIDDPDAALRNYLAAAVAAAPAHAAHAAIGEALAEALSAYVATRTTRAS
jgi:hypothetical protein